MTRNEVVSSNIRSVGYDDQHGVLEIEFTSGGVYRYQDVPKDEYDALMNSGSLGGYFSTYIKNTYRWTKA